MEHASGLKAYFAYPSACFTMKLDRLILAPVAAASMPSKSKPDCLSLFLSVPIGSGDPVFLDKICYARIASG